MRKKYKNWGEGRFFLEFVSGSVFEQNNFFIDKYYDFSEEVLNIYYQFLDKYKIIPNNTIAICYRGNDKCWETHLPSHEDFIEKVQMLKNEYKDFNILLQTDEIEMFDKMKNEFTDLISIDEIKRIYNDKKNQVADTISVDKTKNAISFLAVIKILSECNKIIVNSSNVGLWSILYRGNSNGVYQYLNPKINVTNTKIPNMDGNFWIGLEQKK
jgi:hypothetical protein